MKKYITIHHLNSQGSKRRGEHLEQLRKGMAPHVVTKQVIRVGDLHEEGEPLTKMKTAVDLRALRSRYRPHVGSKQKLKNTRRMLRDPKASLALNA